MQPANGTDQLGNTLMAVVQSAIAQAADQAAAAPGRLRQVVQDALGDAVDEAGKVVELAADKVQQLRDAINHPDWLGLITFMLVRIVDLAGDPHLTVVAYQPGGGWSRAVGLRYASPDLAGGAAELIVSIAIVGDGQHGIVVRVANSPRVNLAPGPARISALADGDGTWRFGFGAPVGAPEAAATLSLEVKLARDLVTVDQDGLALSIGVPRLTVTAAVPPLTWSAEAAFEGAAADGAGVAATVDLAGFLGDLAGVVQLSRIDERYSPLVTLRPGQSPALDLRHVSAP